MHHTKLTSNSQADYFMNNNKPKTIQIYLPKGNPRGLRIAEMTTNIVRLIEIPRIYIDDFLVMSEANQVGLYFLIGDADRGKKPKLYIGQTGELKRRLGQHSTKNFWTRAFVMLSTNNSITQTHTSYMENKAIELAVEVGRYDIQNGNKGNRPYTTAPLQADCEDLFATLDILLSTLGQPIFDSHNVPNGLHDKINQNKTITSIVAKIEQKAPAHSLNLELGPMLFYCEMQRTAAKGYYDDGSFVVLAGSLIRKYHSPTLRKSILSLRNSLISKKILISIDDDTYRLTENQLFTSPSSAGQMVTGRSTNGWTEWKNAAGQTLSSIYR